MTQKNEIRRDLIVERIDKKKTTIKELHQKLQEYNQKGMEASLNNKGEVFIEEGVS